MISDAKIMGGSAAACSGLTVHYLNNTLSPEDARLAAYYSRGAVVDTALLEAALAVASGEMTFSEAMDGLSTDYLRAGRDADLLDDWNMRTTNRLSALVARIEADRENGTDTLNASVAIIRPDIHPLVAKGLGIEAGDILAPKEIDSLLAGLRADNSPIGGKAYAKERRLPVNPKTGEIRHSHPLGSFDFTVSPHKSVSVAWAFSNPLERAKIQDAHTEASREAIAYLAERGLALARKGDGGKDGSVAGEVGWLEFLHHTARRVEMSVEDGVSHVTIDKSAAADPDIHTHYLMVNAVFTPDGKVGSLDTAGLRGLQYEADALYHARLGQKLRDAGFAVDLDERTGSARVSSIPDDISALFSKRTNIGEALARKWTSDRGEDWERLTDGRKRCGTDRVGFELTTRPGAEPAATPRCW